MAFLHTRDFFMTLTCDVRAGGWAEFNLNRTTSARLAPGPWEAALVKLQYPMFYHNFAPGHSWVKAWYEDGTHTTVCFPATRMLWDLSSQGIAQALVPITQECGLEFAWVPANELNASVRALQTPDPSGKPKTLVQLEMSRDAATRMGVPFTSASGKNATHVKYLRPTEAKPAFTDNVPHLDSSGKQTYLWTGETLTAKDGVMGQGAGWIGYRKTTTTSGKCPGMPPRAWACPSIPLPGKTPPTSSTSGPPKPNRPSPTPCPSLISGKQTYLWTGETMTAKDGVMGQGAGWIGYRKTTSTSGTPNTAQDVAYHWIIWPVCPVYYYDAFLTYHKRLFRVGADFLQNNTFDAATTKIKNMPDQPTLAWVTNAWAGLPTSVRFQPTTYRETFPGQFTPQQRTYHACDPGADLSHVRLELKDETNVPLFLYPCGANLTAVVHFRKQ